MCSPLSLSLTCPLLPQKATEMKIHPWNQTLMNHMPQWEGWLSCKRSAFNFSISGCEWRAEDSYSGPAEPHESHRTRGGVPGPWCWPWLQPSPCRQSAWASFPTGAWLTHSTFLDRQSTGRAEAWGWQPPTCASTLATLSPPACPRGPPSREN